MKTHIFSLKGRREKGKKLRGNTDWDVVIVGAGPTGLFTALEIKRAKPDARVLIIEMGKDLNKRNCPLTKAGRCITCPVCDVVSGFGGAGTFSDGKLNLTTEIGGELDSVIGDHSKVIELINYVDNVFLEMGAPQKLYGTDEREVERLRRKALRHGLLLIPFRIRHMGSDGGFKVLKNFRKELESLNVEFIFNRKVEKLNVEEGKIKGVTLNDGEEISSRFVVVAPGRVGSSWLVKEAKRLGIKVEGGKVDLGVRVEVPSEVMSEFTDVLYEPKLIYYSETFDDRVRVFCVNPGGVVIAESYWGIVTVNGMAREDYKTDNTNFAILVTTKFTEPYKDTISYALSIARMANNIAGNQPLVQRYGDLRRGRRSTPERLKRSIVRPTLESAIPGDLSFVLPYRYLKDVIEMLEALNEIMPGIASDHTLLYGVEVKLHTARLDLKENLEVRNVDGLYAGGDGAGVSRGLVQAAASGVWIGRDIARRL